MKNFLASIPNRIKAIYIVWTFIHFILLLLSGNLNRMSFMFSSDFYPFGQMSHRWRYWFQISDYDHSEFLIYVLTPIIIYYAIKLWNKKDAKEPDRN